MSRWYVNCPKCGRDFHVSNGFEGMNVQCRRCGTNVKIPNKSQAKSLAVGAFWLVSIAAIFILDLRFFDALVMGVIVSALCWYFVYKGRRL